MSLVKELLPLINESLGSDVIRAPSTKTALYDLSSYLELLISETNDSSPRQVRQSWLSSSRYVEDLFESFLDRHLKFQDY